MGGAKIRPYNYDSRGGQIQFSAALGIDIETAAAGIEIPEMIRLIEEKKEPALGVLESWCANSLDWFDQYKTMRILASLISEDTTQSQLSAKKYRLRNEHWHAETDQRFS